MNNVTLMFMKPVQVYFPDDDAERLEQWAKARHISKSEAIRLAVGALLRREETDPLFAVIGMFSSRRDASVRVEEDLARAIRVTKTKAEPAAKGAVRRHGRVARRSRSA